MEYGFATKCIYGNGSKTECDHSGAISFPIYQSATFAHHGVGESTGYDYSRLQNPTREQLEKVVASLEQGCDALAFSNGMAAITTLMELFRAGDHVIAGNDLYGGTIRLFDTISSKREIVVEYADTSSDNIEQLIRPTTKAIYVETPSNPMMNITDIRKMKQISEKYNLMLIVDNTFLSPYFQNPLELGADVVVHSGTKFLGGHNDTLAGFLIISDRELSEKLRFLYKTVGSGLSPFDSWLILRGIKTLAVRMERQEKNAYQIALWLKQQTKVKKVYYPGLVEHPGYEVNKSQSRGFGSILSFQVDSKETALTVLKNVRTIQFAESLGGVESLITYPVTQTHADVPSDIREKNGITECILRLSVGIEDLEDLKLDLQQAFYKKGEGH